MFSLKFDILDNGVIWWNTLNDMSLYEKLGDIFERLKT